MALIIDLSRFFSEVLENNQPSLTKTSDDRANIFDDGVRLVYGDVQPFYRREAAWFLKELNEKFASSQFDQSMQGEYAVACLDRAARTISLSKDFSGTRNIYYAIEEGKLILGVNVFDVLAQLNCRRFNILACLEFLTFEYYAAPQTLFEGVHTITHGSTLVLNQEGGLVKHIHPPALSQIEETNPEQWRTLLRQKIIAAHERRLGGRNGIYLSGGIDSSVMAVTLKKDLGVSDLLAVSFSTKDAERNESRQAERAAQQLGIKLEKIEVDPSASVDLDSIIGKSNFPYVGSLILSAVGDRIVGSGQAGITLFAGQDSRIHTPPYNPIDNIVLNRLAISPAARRALAGLSQVLSPFLRKGKIGKGLERLTHSDDLSLYLYRYFLHLHRHSSLTTGAVFQELKNNINQNIASKIANAKSPLAMMNALVDLCWDRQYICDMAYMIDNTASFGAQCSMPFYDVDFTRFSASLPMSYKTKLSVGRAGHTGKLTTVNKFPLREAYKGDLSHDLIYREKAVCITNHMYLNGSLAPYVQEYFRNPKLGELGLVDKLNVQGLINKAVTNSGKWAISDYDEVVEVHNLLFLEVIARKYNLESSAK